MACRFGSRQVWPEGAGPAAGWGVDRQWPEGHDKRERGRRRGKLWGRYCRRLSRQFPLRPSSLPHARPYMRGWQWLLSRQFATVDPSIRLPRFPCLAALSSSAPFQRDAFVKRLLRCSTSARDSGDGGGEIAAEGLLGRNRLPAFSFAPAPPGVVQRIDADTMPSTDNAGVAHECGNGRREIFDLLHYVANAGRHHEAASLPQASPTFNRPVQDTGQFAEQSAAQRVVPLPASKCSELDWLAPSMRHCSA